MSGRETPSRIIVEALLEYSRGKRRTQKKHQCRNKEQRDSPLPQVQEQINEPIATTTAKSALPAHTEVFVDCGGEKTASLESIGALSSIRTLSSIPSSLKSENEQLDKSIDAIDAIFDDTYDMIDMVRVDYSDGKSSMGQIDVPQTGTIEECNKEETSEMQTVYSSTPLYFDKEVITDKSTGHSGFCICFKTHQYPVQRELKDGDNPAQTAFIQKVFMVLVLKTLVILGWLKAVEITNVLHMHYESYHRYHYIAGLVYFLIKMLIRIMSNYRNRYCFIFVYLFIFETIAACNFLQSVLTSNGCGWLDGHLIVARYILYCILGTYLFFIVVGSFVSYDMRDAVMIGTAMIITGIIAIHQFLHSKSTSSLTNFGLEKFPTDNILDDVISSLAVLGVSELFVIMIMFELRSVLVGRRFPVTSRDWFFTAMYVI